MTYEVSTSLLTQIAVRLNSKLMMFQSATMDIGAFPFQCSTDYFVLRLMDLCPLFDKILESEHVKTAQIFSAK